MNVVYEKATISDAWDILHTGVYCWKETYTGFVPDDYLEYMIRHFEEKVERQKILIEDSNNNYYLAKVDGKTAGYVLCDKAENEQYKNYGHIGALYLLKEYQGYGIGKGLFKTALEELKKRGYTKMSLECMAGNKTVDFYKKYLGKIVDTIDYPLNGGKFFVKADIMLFDIDEALKALNNK